MRALQHVGMFVTWRSPWTLVGIDQKGKKQGKKNPCGPLSSLSHIKQGDVMAASKV